MNKKEGERGGTVLRVKGEQPQKDQTNSRKSQSSTWQGAQGTGDTVLQGISNSHVLPTSPNWVGGMESGLYKYQL